MGLHTPIKATPSHACGFADYGVATALGHLRAMPAPECPEAAMRLRWAIEALESSLKALRAPFDHMQEIAA
jgi:hypothetical protein